MKKILLICALVTALATSCVKKNVGPTEFKSTYMLTVCESDDQEFGLYFESDTHETLRVIANNTTQDLTELENGARIAVLGIVDKSTTDDFDYTIEVFNIFDVIEGEYVAVDDAEADAAIADDNLSYIFSSVGLYKGYLNMLVGYKTADVENVKFRLVTNNVTEPETTEEGFLNLELRYDDASSDDDADVKATTSAKEYDDYLSFDLEPIRDLLEGKDGIILRIKSVKSGTKYIKLESKNIY